MVDLDALGVNIHGIYTNQLVCFILPSAFYVLQLVCDLDEAKIQLKRALTTQGNREEFLIETS